MILSVWAILFTSRCTLVIIELLQGQSILVFKRKASQDMKSSKHLVISYSQLYMTTTIPLFLQRKFASEFLESYTLLSKEESKPPIPTFTLAKKECFWKIYSLMIRWEDIILMGFYLQQVRLLSPTTQSQLTLSN